MRRRRLVAAASLTLAVPSVAAVALVSAGQSGSVASPSVVTRTVPAIGAASSLPPIPVAPTTTSAPAIATTAPTATTTTTTTSVAPIVTHDARVGVGVLVPVVVAAPVRVVIPSLGADGPVVPGGVDAAGALQIPGDARTLVWWKFGPTPGASGSAVIAGHLDWKGVAGIFNRLADTPIGERISVAYDDGHEQAFVVTSVQLVDKPAVAVDGTFARDGEPVLRLVTCGGEFDRATHHYRSNVIVTAVPA